jgi:hypothetical protein
MRRVVKERTMENTAEMGGFVLRPTGMEIGKIETNIEQVLEAVKEKSKEYQDVAKYQGDDKKAKEDRALLRKQKDMTKATIASIQEVWNKPLEQFLSTGKKILQEFDLAIDTIDGWVKEGEAREKEKKRIEIESYFNSKNFSLVPLEKFFNPRWLNKTVPLKDARDEIDAKIAEIYTNIKTLEGISEYGAMAKAFYLNALDMGAALRQVETTKANAEKLAREKLEREERERRGQCEANAAEERREERKAEREERISSLAAEALELPEAKASPEEEVIEYTLKFRGTKGQLLRLREFMSANGIAYEKVG